jgi:phosphoglycolate phosphatase
LYRRIIFDLDGTLTDPKVGILRCINHALESQGFPRIAESGGAHLWVVGPPLRDVFRRIVGEEAFPPLVEELVAKYRERYESVGMFENFVYPGVSDMLVRLKAAGRVLAVATTKPEAYAKRIVEHFGLGSAFDALVGSSLDGSGSEKRELIMRAAEVVGGELPDFVMVGDRDFDILGAKEAGVDSVGVLYGYGSRAEILSSEPTYVVGSVEELGDLLLPRSE